MRETLTDPSLGTLHRRDELEWEGRVWFTPRHEVQVVFDQWDEDAADVPQRLARAGEAYATLRRREWENRLALAAMLLEEHADEWAGTPPAPEELARLLVLVLVEVFDDRSAGLTHHLPEPFADREARSSLGLEGEFTAARLHPRVKR
jgi:hypothetical protein